MQVILMRDVRHTGRRGEIVEVKPGYARNYLVPRGLALKATPGNIKVFEQQKRKIEIHHVKERDAAAEIAAQLAELSVQIHKRVGETETL